MGHCCYLFGPSVNNLTVPGNMTTRRGIFITGTDTGIGKTFVATRLIRSLNRMGIAVIPRKPVESGCTRVGDRLVPADALALAEMAGAQTSLNEICPYRLEHPLSPERAAKLEGIDYDLQDLVQACLVPSDRFLIVEGAGGFYSPLAANGLNADLAQHLNLPVLLVAADRLGCINHVLLTLDAIASRDLTLTAVVLSQPIPPFPPHMDNLEDLRNCLDYPVVRLNYSPASQEAPEEDKEFTELAKIVLEAVLKPLSWHDTAL
jgi:dethiobiotin synthetase